MDYYVNNFDKLQKIEYELNFVNNLFMTKEYLKECFKKLGVYREVVHTKSFDSDTSVITINDVCNKLIENFTNYNQDFINRILYLPVCNIPDSPPINPSFTIKYNYLEEFKSSVLIDRSEEGIAEFYYFLYRCPVNISSFQDIFGVPIFDKIYIMDYTDFSFESIKCMDKTLPVINSTYIDLFQLNALTSSYAITSKSSDALLSDNSDYIVKAPLNTSLYTLEVFIELVRYFAMRNNFDRDKYYKFIYEPVAKINAYIGDAESSMKGLIAPTCWARY